MPLVGPQVAWGHTPEIANNNGSEGIPPNSSNDNRPEDDEDTLEHDLFHKALMGCQTQQPQNPQYDEQLPDDPQPDFSLIFGNTNVRCPAAWHVGAQDEVEG